LYFLTQMNVDSRGFPGRQWRGLSRREVAAG
jgi:hypothetical protein